MLDSSFLWHFIFVLFVRQACHCSYELCINCKGIHSFPPKGTKLTSLPVFEGCSLGPWARLWPLRLLKCQRCCDVNIFLSHADCSNTNPIQHTTLKLIFLESKHCESAYISQMTKGSGLVINQPGYVI